MSAAHTPTPWHVWVDDSGDEFTGWPSISAAEDLDTTVIHRAGFKQEFWGDLSQRETRANAEFIVRAVNNFYGLVEALKRCRQGWQNLDEMFGVDPDAAIAEIDADLAKAEAES